MMIKNIKNKNSVKIRTCLSYFLIMTFFLSLLTHRSFSKQLAFPTAEGFGKYTVGGRGGQVCEVTNLNDKGEGSLRAAVNTYGPRTVVFRVSGTIELESDLTIYYPHITIAGQTAPGDGICLRKYPVNIEADEVIIRYIRVRLGDESGADDDAISSRYTRNIILDHVSAGWSIDETVSIYHCDSVTVQWCLISESLYNAGHEKGHHGYGGIWGGPNASFHHNLMVHHSSRNPRFASGCGYTDFRNNVIYNWGYMSVYGGEKVEQNSTVYTYTGINMVANYYKQGPGTKGGSNYYKIVQPSSRNFLVDYGEWYITDNYVCDYPEVTADNWTLGVQPDDNHPTVKDSIRQDTPLPYVPIIQQTAEKAYRLVLYDAGATLPQRDSVDTRIIREVATGTATYGTGSYNNDNYFGTDTTGIIDSQTEVGGWPVLLSEPAPEDSDHDGMPDSWENDHGLNSNDAEDRNGIGEGGYTNLEIYLNSMIDYPSTVEKKIQTDPDGFLLYQNYPNPFNTSTTILFQIPVRALLELNIYDIRGRTVRSLIKQWYDAGDHSIQWDGLDDAGRQVTSGLYYSILESNGYRFTRKMIMLK